MKQQQLQLVTFEQAKKLKELGFDWMCYRYRYLDDGSLDDDTDKKLCNWNASDIIDLGKDDAKEIVCSSPTVALALKWFRDVKGIRSSVTLFSSEETYSFTFDGDEGRFCITYYYSYEQAENALLNELLTLMELK